MPIFAAPRRIMVDNQLRTIDVTNLDVLDAFGAVPRETFVAAGDAALAYLDRDIPIAPGRYLQRAGGLAKLLQAADIRPVDRVLVVGAGTGYAAAIVARLAAEVVALEEVPALADAAKANLLALGVGNVKVVTGPLGKGAAGEGPFHVVIVDGAVAELSPTLAQQLADGGRLAVVIGTGLSGRAHLYVKSGSDLAARGLFNWASPLLPGTTPAPTFVF